MEFHVQLAGERPDLARIGDVLLGEDPAALLDVDEAEDVLRISTWLPAGDLLTLLRQADCAGPPERLRQLPSVCCGGCSG